MVVAFILGLAVGIFIGLRVGRAWAFRKLGGFEYKERIRRAKGGSIL